MDKTTLRREFLKSSLWATGGILLAGTSKTFGQINTRSLTLPNNSECDIRTSIFGKQIEIFGRVYDGSGKRPVANAEIEFWHMSPRLKIVGHKSILTTDNNGRYRLFSDYPSFEKGKHKTVHFRVSRFEKSYETQLKFSNQFAYITDEHWEANNFLPDDLLFPKMEKTYNRTKINFNISINS